MSYNILADAYMQDLEFLSNRCEYKWRNIDSMTIIAKATLGDHINNDITTSEYDFLLNQLLDCAATIQTSSHYGDNDDIAGES